MSQRAFSTEFRRRRAGPMVAACLAALALACGGCASISIEEAVPTAALAPADQSAFPPPPNAAGQPPAPSLTVQAPAAAQPDRTAEVGTTRDGTGPAEPRDTGQYPNLNVPQTGATGQMTVIDVRTKTREIRDAAVAQRKEGSNVTVKESDVERLRRLGQKHGEDALNQIEKTSGSKAGG